MKSLDQHQPPSFTNGFHSAGLVASRNFPYDANNHTYLDNRVTNSHQRKKKSRSETVEARQNTKKHLVRLANEIRDSELADRLSRCHSRVGFLSCGQHVLNVLPNYVCEFRLCPDCARRRSRKMQNKYLPMLSVFAQRHRVTPVHLVLTQTHRKETRKQSVERLKKAFGKLIRRDFWLEHFKGGTWSVEFTKDGNGLHHTHLHIIGFRSKFFHIDLLRDEWLSATGDSHVLRLDRITNLAEGIKEVFKYISKPLDVDRFTADDLRDFLKLKNVRFFGTFGDFRAFCRDFSVVDNEGAAVSGNSLVSDLVEGCACPYCQRPLFEQRMSAGSFLKYLKKIDDSPPG